MKKIVAVFVAALVLAGCGTRPYTPRESPLRDGLITKMTVSGDVKVSNGQPSDSQAIVYSYGGTQLASTYKDITQLMVEQARKEIDKNGKAVPSSKAKTIDLKVTYLQSTYGAWYWKSEIKFTATLGNSDIIEKTVTHGGGNVIQDLNGCVAESVMNLLNDPKVIAYLGE